MESVGDARVFPTFNCIAGYWNSPMGLHDISTTGSTCLMGTYEYLMMAFGLNTSPGALQCALEMISSGITWQTCNVYGRFVANYACIVASLNHSTSRAYRYFLPSFTAIQSAALGQLPDELLHRPVLAPPRRGPPFATHVDACGTQLGCALIQEQQDGML